MLRQSLSILKQLGSASKSQDATELLHEDLVLVEQRVEPAKKAAQLIHKKLQGCMQSQPGLEAEKRMKKLPLMLLSISMAESLKDFDAESSIRRVLEMCCFMEKMLANMLADYEMKVEKAVLEPLNKLSEVGVTPSTRWQSGQKIKQFCFPSQEDLPEILRNKKQFAKLTTDWNSAKIRSPGKAGRAPRGGGRSLEEVGEHQGIRRPSPGDPVWPLLGDCWPLLLCPQDQYSADLYHFATKEQEYANYFIQFIELQAEYHKNSHEFLSKNISELKDNYLQKGPPVSVSSQRVYGESLPVHLSQSSREIAVPLQECIHMLLRTGMREEVREREKRTGAEARPLCDAAAPAGLVLQGLFRLAAAASVVKRLKTCLDQGAVDHSEFSMDPHAVAGALKCYLRELPEPLMTFDLYKDWFKAAGEKDLSEKLEQFRVLLQKLPADNYNNLRYLVQFLSLLSEQQAVNKMTPSNIAIVLGPNLLWPRAEGEIVSLDMASASSVQVVMVIEPLIQYSSSLFPEAVSFEIPNLPQVPDGAASAPASQSLMSVKEKVGRTDSSSSSVASTSSWHHAPLSKMNSAASQDGAGLLLVKSSSVSRSGTSTWASPDPQPAASSPASAAGTSGTSAANQNLRPPPKATGASGPAKSPTQRQCFDQSRLEPTLEEPPDSPCATVVTSSCKPPEQLAVQYTKARAPAAPRPRAPPPPARAPGTADASKARPIPAPRGTTGTLKKPPPKKPGPKAPNCPPPLPPPSQP
ncbi:unnamed protein product, partial [Tetraodon nigroviridis]